MTKHNEILPLAIFLMVIMMVSPFVGISTSITKAQGENNSHNFGHMTNNNNTASMNISQNSSIADIDKKMIDISTSNKSKDIATLAYIWGYPLVTMQRSFDYFTNPSIHVLGAGPANNINFVRELMNASFKDVVSPNSDTLYGMAWLDLSKEPVVLKVPSIEKNRYFSFQFLDAYTNDYAYVGTRATGSGGGTYLIAGPQWNGTVPDGMTKIWAPTNLNWILQRTLVKGPSDVPNVHAIQDKSKLMPLSVYINSGKNVTNSSNTLAKSMDAAVITKTNTTDTIQNPINPAPQFIPATGIKIYDEISKAMIGNPLNPPDPTLIKKFAAIGIGPGKSPSTQANDTVKKALEMGIAEGEKLIDAKVAHLGEVVNGWLVNAAPGIYGTDYLLRAAFTKFGFGAHIGQEGLFPATFTDSDGKSLVGSSNYTIHFEPGQTPPVKAFWSITLYNDKSLFVDNPINRYSVGMFTGLKNNRDGSIDVYIQNANPGPQKISNWLPASRGSFNLVLRMYLPEQSALNGTWSPPPVIKSK